MIWGPAWYADRMNVLLLGLVLISPPFLKKLLLRWFAQAEIAPTAQIGWFSAVSARRITLGAHSVIRPLTLVRVEGEVALAPYAEVSSFNLVYGAGSFYLGQGSYVGPQSLINADEPVRIGQGSALGPRSMVFTHGSFLPYTEGYWVKLAGVTVGDKVWCAAGVFLHPGVEIGDNSFVNSMAVVSGAIPPGSVVEGNPAKVVYPMARVQRKMTPRLRDAALERILADFAEVVLRRELGVTALDAAPHRLRFTWRGQAYQVGLIASTGAPPEAPPAGARLVALVNAPEWAAPADALVLDVLRGEARFHADPIHTALRLFALRYFGVRFIEPVSQ